MSSMAYLNFSALPMRLNKNASRKSATLPLKPEYLE